MCAELVLVEPPMFVEVSMSFVRVMLEVFFIGRVGDKCKRLAACRCSSEIALAMQAWVVGTWSEM